MREREREMREEKEDKGTDSASPRIANGGCTRQVSNRIHLPPTIPPFRLFLLPKLSTLPSHLLHLHPTRDTLHQEINSFSRLTLERNYMTEKLHDGKMT